jgi:nitrous oxide reductase accessory protein NosL
MIYRAGLMIIMMQVLLLQYSCSNENDKGPIEVRWDREVCTRCAMAVGDRKYAAQIRGGQEGHKRRFYNFDDIGCAVIWLDNQSWKDGASTEIWVSDHRTGKWIDAQSAWYVEVDHTPMDYGLGAQTEQQRNAMNFARAREHIYREEERLNAHTGQAHPGHNFAGSDK